MNDNLPDMKEYKKYNYKLTPFKLCVLENFPFIEADFDAITNYQLLCKVVEYLNHVIDNQNTVEDNFKIMADNLTTLYNFLDTLDLQDEVNNKLDEMTEDGTLAKIINEQIFNNLNTLIGSTNNPLYYGADNTGVNDSTQAINQCIQANKGGVINFTPGTYKVTSSILLPFDNSEKVSINGNGAHIITTGDINYLFFVGYDRPNENSNNNVGFPSYIKDLFINCENSNVNYGVYNVKGFKDLKIINCYFYRVKNGILVAESSGSPSDILVSECLIYGKGSEYEGVGIIINGSDNNIESSRIYGFRTGMSINAYTTVTSVHVLLRWENQTSSNFDPYPVGSAIFNEYYLQTSFAIVNSACRIVTCYADSVYKFLDIGDISYHVVLTSSFYYNSRSNVNQHVVDCLGSSIKLDITDCQFSLKIGEDVSLLRCTATKGFFDVYSQITISGIEIIGIRALTNYSDIMLYGYSNKRHANISMLNDTWYVISTLANWADNSKGDMDIFINDWKYSVHFAENNNVLSCSQYNSGTSTTHYTIGFVKDGHNVYVCVKPDQNTGGDKLNSTLNESNNLLFNVAPAYEDSIYASSRLLSNFTSNTPTQILNLKQAYNIINSSSVN